MVYNRRDRDRRERVRMGCAVKDGKPLAGNTIPRVEQPDHVTQQPRRRRELLKRPAYNAHVNGKSFRVRQTGPKIVPPFNNKFVRSQSNTADVEDASWERFSRYVNR